ncbi:Hypothetical protein EMIHUDRAFT_204393 [Emiliania huxleyi CCMP1516]|uniref:Uncharacterized protein n=2 Tax=Emiliania huxleyi TaxID=2903 RepID=A0A0D3JYB8_EMIH1|nr:Hypothetical protein EMIHUDRAFT_204393 [Emiliania huxleyi CCMP1516]EOD28503.1 Hypothetical protein EMIHUDRAFT_204393 [Emiliania huxleyi CCMP1516]|eukprot:XP_005780932.1 Hypothetical protein EMIHUDRAFT_204393 [Emiliania huxleyi CCMP1516]
MTRRQHANKFRWRVRPLGFGGWAARNLAACPLCDTASLRGGKHVDVLLGDPANAVKPASDGGPLQGIGSGDRGSGLTYRLGRMAPGMLASLQELAAKAAASPRQGVWVVKAQAPLDNSSDAAGGIGRMTPATLLLHDEAFEFVHFVKEEEAGHSALLRATLRQPAQVAYLYAEHLPPDNASPERYLRLYVESQPEAEW